MQHQTLTPVSTQERIQTIDIIRGFALFGILIVNFKNIISNNSSPNQWPGFADVSVRWFISFFMNDKMWPIYIFLFGLGSALQMERFAVRGTNFGWLYLRRMIVLYIIGVAQVIFTSDSVIHDYAMIGVLLLLFWKVPNKFLPLLGILFMIVPMIRNEIVSLERRERLTAMKPVNVDTTILNKYIGVYELTPGQRQIIRRNSDTLIGEGPGRRYYMTALSDTHFIRKDLNWIMTFTKDSAGKMNELNAQLPNGNRFTARRIQTDFQEALKKQIEQRTRPNTRQRPSTYADFIKTRADNFWNGLKNMTWEGFIWGSYYIEWVLSLMLIGMYVGRRKIFSNVSANRGFIRKTMFWGLGVGLIAIAIDAGTKWSRLENLYIRDLIGLFIDHYIVFLSLGYVAALTLLVENKTWKNRLSFFAPVGQMGLTSYILHTIALTVVFEKFALGFLGKVGQFYGLLLAIGVFVLIYIFSRLWLKHFKYGPFEWLWRSLTYLKFQPMRLNSKNENQSL